MKVYITMDLMLGNVPMSEWRDDKMAIINDLIENGTNNGYYAQDMRVELEDIRINTIRFEEE